MITGIGKEEIESEMHTITTMGGPHSQYLYMLYIYRFYFNQGYDFLEIKREIQLGFAKQDGLVVFKPSYTDDDDDDVRGQSNFNVFSDVFN